MPDFGFYTHKGEKTGSSRGCLPWAHVGKKRNLTFAFSLGPCPVIPRNCNEKNPLQNKASAISPLALFQINFLWIFRS